MEFWNLHLIRDFEISFLLEPVRFKKKNDLVENDLMKYYEQVESFYDETQPVNVYISYPFSVDLEFKVYPINQIGRKTFKLLPIGYLAWQVSKLFEKLFLLGLDGMEISGLTDLQLTSFRVFDNNNFILEVSS